MKKLIALILLSSLPVLTNAQNCPPAPDGYYFSVAAWGNHAVTRDAVRCHYYKSGDDSGTSGITIRTIETFNETDITKHAEWGNIGELYHLCNARSGEISSCPFN